VKVAALQKCLDYWIKLGKEWCEANKDAETGAMPDLKSGIDNVMQDAGIGVREGNAVLREAWGKDAPEGLRLVVWPYGGKTADWPGPIGLGLAYDEGSGVKWSWHLRSTIELDGNALPPK
jgi:hypothetical protein